MGKRVYKLHLNAPPRGEEKELDPTIGHHQLIQSGGLFLGTNLQSREPEQKDRQADGEGCAATRQRRDGKDGTGAGQAYR